MTNPFFTTWTTPFQAVPFDQIKDEHYKPAFEEGMRQHNAEIEAIATNPEPATFENTIIPLEKAGRLLDQVHLVFANLMLTDATEMMRGLDKELTPILSAHGVKIGQDQRLFDRIKKIYSDRDKLNPAQLRVVKVYFDGYVRTGADLNSDDKKIFSDISGRLATLASQFDQKLIDENSDFELVLESEDDLRGLSPQLVAAARRAADAKGHDGKALITLLDPSARPFLKFSERRDLRERVFKAMLARNDRGGAYDTNQDIIEMLNLRLQKARLLGYNSTADYMFHERMVAAPADAKQFLLDTLTPAKNAAAKEYDKLLALHREHGHADDIQPWDWSFYAEKYRQLTFDVNENELRAYFPLDKVIEAAFWCAEQLFGIRVTPLKGAPLYNPDVLVWSVTAADGTSLGLFYGDFYARASKGGGAWCSNLRLANALLNGRPFGINCSNFSKPEEGKPCLVSPLEVEHVFHEFGHTLHDLLSQAPYPAIYGRSVARDFVELPSQLFEHWAFTDEVLEKFFRHWQTGEVLSTNKRKAIKESLKFGEGYQTAMYIVVALTELELHMASDYKGLDLNDYQSAYLKSLNLPLYLTPRYRLQHFHHVFGNDYYAGYYGYLWAAVLDADAFKAFKETGNVFDSATAKRLYDHIYSAGNTDDPAVLYQKFRGRAPTIDALLEHRGLDGKAA